MSRTDNESDRLYIDEDGSNCSSPTSSKRRKYTEEEDSAIVKFIGNSKSLNVTKSIFRSMVEEKVRPVG